MGASKQFQLSPGCLASSRLVQQAAGIAACLFGEMVSIEQGLAPSLFIQRGSGVFTPGSRGVSGRYKFVVADRYGPLDPFAFPTSGRSSQRCAPWQRSL